jgi:hypothetical protein
MRMLDLYCGEGLAAWGYWRSGRFSEIVGVDINHVKLARYSFDKHLANCLSLDYDFLAGFDFVHASPPCQAYSKITPHPERHLRLIAATHLMLKAAGVPYCIENVEGSSSELRPNLVLDGQAVGLTSKRRRYFHVSTLKKALRRISMSRASHTQGCMNRQEAIECMGLGMINQNRLNLITLTGMEQGVPPAMTLLIAELMFPAYKAMSPTRGKLTNGL